MTTRLWSYRPVPGQRPVVVILTDEQALDRLERGCQLESLDPELTKLDPRRADRYIADDEDQVITPAEEVRAT